MTIRAAELQSYIRAEGALPLSWAGSTSTMDYLNLGDALSPVMVALCCGLPIERVPVRSTRPRLAAVGTIGHGLSGGAAWFWGTGTSQYRNPSAAEPELYVRPTNMKMTVCATRGPLSRRILTGEEPPGDAVYGDPVWLLPRFFKPATEKKWELGVILHLSELRDRNVEEAHPNEKYKRYGVPEEFKDDVRLINTVTGISPSAMRERLETILQCKRLVSTSLHGMVFAESYGIPCLYFSPGYGRAEGLTRVSLKDPERVDPRIVDLYTGLGMSELDIFVQQRDKPTDWAELMAAIDRAWAPKDYDPSQLLDVFPLEVKLLKAPGRGDIFDLPEIASLKFQHDVDRLRERERTFVHQHP